MNDDFMSRLLSYRFQSLRSKRLMRTGLSGRPHCGGRQESILALTTCSMSHTLEKAKFMPYIIYNIIRLLHLKADSILFEVDHNEAHIHH